MNVIETAKLAKTASVKLLQLSTETKNLALENIAKMLEAKKEAIYAANKADLENSKAALEAGKLSQAVFNRLKLDDNKLRDMISGVRDLIKLDDPVNKVFWSKDIADGMTLTKISCPIGVIGVIFEARPDVISQISSLAIKSSNAVILKGGSEAEQTNRTIFEVIKAGLSATPGYPENAVNLIFSREDVREMLEADKYINLIIPRGSNSLVQFIKSNTKIPVLGHADGICHIYIDESADKDKAAKIVTDAKCQYPSACNAVETLLINENCPKETVLAIFEALKQNGVKINGDEAIKKHYPDYISDIVEEWHKEYGEKILSAKFVKDTDEAINHINTYGSGHTESIITENKDNAEKFMLFTDSSGVYQNASTRFSDGFRYGFGAEVGISTNKTHARGPVGLEGLTIYKYKIVGNGDIVADFVSGKRKFNK